MKLAKQVIDIFEGELNLKDYKDEYKEGLRKIIDAQEWPAKKSCAEEIEEPPTNVVDLMEALRKSLDAVSSAKKKPAKAELPEGVARRAEEERRQLDEPRTEPRAAQVARAGRVSDGAALVPTPTPASRPSAAEQPPRAVRVQWPSGSPIQSGGVSHTNARIAITQMS